MSWDQLWYGSDADGARRWLRLGLSPLSALFGAGVAVNEALWRTGLRRSARIDGARVVSVGNVLVGGTGKTPVVVFLARWASAAGHSVAVLSRGYGRRGRDVVRFSAEAPPPAIEVGDEPRLIARVCPRAEVWVGPDRVELARRARASGATFILLDDGFQHRRLARDVDVVVHRGGAARGLLPMGPYREGLAALARASVVWVPDETDVDHPVLVRARHAARGVRSREGHLVSPEELRGARVVLLVGIARPERVEETATRLGVHVVERVVWPDHAAYSTTDVARMAALARSHGARILTTEKDAERLPDSLPVWTIELGVEVLQGLEHLARLLGLDAGLVPQAQR